MKQELSEDKETSFETVWNEYYPKLTVFLQTSFGFSDTEDLVQNIMIKIFRKLDSFNPAYSLSTWIFSIARNSALDEFRKSKRMSSSLEILKSELLVKDKTVESRTPESLFLQKEQNSFLDLFIKKLPQTEREITYLRFYEELQYSEISRITGIPSGTVKYSVHVIKNKLKKHYGEHYENK